MAPSRTTTGSRTSTSASDAKALKRLLARPITEVMSRRCLVRVETDRGIVFETVQAADALLPDVAFDLVVGSRDARREPELIASATLAVCLTPRVDALAVYAAVGLPIIAVRELSPIVPAWLADWVLFCQLEPGALAEAISESLEWDWSRAVSGARDAERRAR